MKAEKGRPIIDFDGASSGVQLEIGGAAACSCLAGMENPQWQQTSKAGSRADGTRGSRPPRQETSPHSVQNGRYLESNATKCRPDFPRRRNRLFPHPPSSPRQHGILGIAFREEGVDGEKEKMVQSRVSGFCSVRMNRNGTDEVIPPRQLSPRSSGPETK